MGNFREGFPRPLRQVDKKKGDRAYYYVREGKKNKKVYLGLWKSKKARKEYDRRKRIFDATGVILTNPVRNRPGISVRELADRFSEWAVENYVDSTGRRTRTEERYFAALSVVCELFGDISADSFDLECLELIQTALIKKGTLCRKTINVRIRAIIHVFLWGARRRLVKFKTYEKLRIIESIAIGKRGTFDHPRVKAVPRSVVEATLPFLTPTVADMVRLQLLTGARPEEIRIMRPVDLERVENGLWRYHPSHDKTSWARGEGERKEIPIGPKGIDIIIRNSLDLPTDSDKYVFRPEESFRDRIANDAQKRQTKITPSQLKRKQERAKNPRKFKPFFDSWAYYKAVSRACKKAGVPHWTPYQLRHLAATETVERHGWRKAQLLLGHKNPDTTKIYVDENRKLLEELARKEG